MLMVTRTARPHETAAASAKLRSSFYRFGDAGECGESGEESDSVIPPLSGPGSSPKALVPYASNDALPPNPWRQRTTVGDLERAQRTNPRGVAQFRPVLQAAEETLGSSLSESKPLLEPYLYAQELARTATVDAWHLRRSRYLQRLQNGAATQREVCMADGGPRCRSSRLDTRMSALPRLGSSDDYSSNKRHNRNAAEKGGLDSHRARTSSTTPTTLPLLAPSSPVESPEITKESTFSRTDASASGWRMSSGANDASPLLSGANPNVLAVRCLFQAARMEAAAAAAGNAGWAAPSFPEPADEIVFSLSAQSTSDSHRQQPRAFLTYKPTGTRLKGRADAMPSDCGDAAGPKADTDTLPKVAAASGAASAAPLGLLGNLFIDDATRAFFGCGDTDRNEEELVDTSHSTVTPPSEHGLPDILRDRMHQRVATFTSSAKHTLDEPPMTAKTHAILGKARLAINTSTQALLIQAERSERRSRAVASGEAWPAQPASAISQNLVRAMRQLLYAEEYERGLLCQLAQQSSPTRWYSTLLPNGSDGIRFRLLIPPTMTDDVAVHDRLYGAIRRASQAIAQPRRDAVAAEEARRRAPLPVLDKSSVDHSFCATDDAQLTVERAGAEKTLLFKRWISLHENLSAQLRLFTEEVEQRRRLLGEFLSCKHPFPCMCLSCDLEVLAMSAVQLEPTVKPACWYASVVLGRHKDVLQEELLARYRAERHRLYDLFKVEFSALYTYKKLVSDEAQRFGHMIRYHEFCLCAAASRECERQQLRSEDLPLADVVTPRPSSAISTALTPEQTAPLEVVDKSAAAPPMHAHLLHRGGSRMWQLRQRRLRCCDAFDSPFFSYVLYTEVLTTVAAEEEVRTMRMVSETAERAELKASMMAEKSFACLSESERQARVRISAQRDEAYSALCAGPLVELQAAHAAELHTAQVAEYAKSCEEARQSFVVTAVAAKMAAEEGEMNWYRHFVFEMRQRSLALLVAGRSAAQATTASREWLGCQQHVSLFHSERRLRDRVALVEETDARVRIMAAAEASLRHARKREARRLSEEAADMREAVQRVAESVRRAHDVEEAAVRAQLQREERAADPSKRPSAKMRADTVNSFFRMTTEIKEDFDVFLPSLGSDA
ncbi:conserved hypothetical protein [Leishmania major strain Friedlin]|uniref:Uncharacterized protein n=1 Tax=Leishmania major TaxID=5664 RepID=Q4Q8E0_LEIMA|nr:conserved hypothetical protein [Leishmania major strain Friedlin]CAG9577234.1 hypothetical_protein_-_conserved [Leishmania major strain Friedlin]CAJ05361.1 conserved hypothetical protein [Leishmania major strain Friedlin]|eukprot:XP_001684408.1 conserved hypothetical protein [Leishmania major strain Friedlin]